MKKIAELEQENDELKLKLSPENINRLYEFAKKDIIDSIVLGITTQDKMLSDTWDVFYAYNTMTSKSIKLHERYNSDVHFVAKNDNHFDSIYYTVPSKNKLISGWKNDYKKMKKAKDKFSYIPEDTGWYYCYILVLIKNKHTGSVTTYPIPDSFYVYK